MNHPDKIKLYGAENCHKTQFYKKFLEKLSVKFAFLDVINDKAVEHELRKMYASGKANFPTIVIGHKKLRNPSQKELLKWLKRAEAANFKDPKTPIFKSEKLIFTCGISKSPHDINDAIEY